MSQTLCRYIVTVVTISSVALLTGCQKFVAVDSPKNSLTSVTVFSSDQGALSAMAGLYSQLTQVNLNLPTGGVTVFCGLSADELINSSANTNYDPFRTNNLTPDVSALGTRFWSVAYKNVYQANAILEGVAASDGMSVAVKRQVQGEALVIRAFHYYYLANLFGDVPYLTTTNYQVNASLGRASMVEVFTGIKNDLLQATSLLGENYPSSGKGRPNKFTAMALLARVHLHLGSWADAETMADSVINSGRYSLVANLNNVFAATSAEVIWHLLRDNNNTGEGANFVPASGTVLPTFALAPQLLNAFETNDNRKTAWIGRNTVNGVAYFYPFKYKLRTSTPIQEYLAVVRLAELYLIRAEARANQNKLTPSLSDLTIVRSRAGLASLNLSNQQSLLTAIYKERQTELFAEWGHRWFDLKRTQRADAVLATIKGAEWQSTDVLYPIPLAEILRNPSLTQNSGY